MTDRPPGPEQPDDSRLLARFAAGDEEAFGSLAERYEPHLFGLAMGMLGRRDLALDALQDTWVRVMRAAPRFRAESSFKTWVYRILINRCLDLRARAARRSTLAVAGVQRGHTHAAAAPGEDARESLHAAMESLTDAQRTVVMLCYHRGMTHTQAAEVLGIPLGTLKSRLSAALASLRAAMDGAPPAHTEMHP